MNPSGNYSYQIPNVTKCGNLPPGYVKPTWSQTATATNSTVTAPPQSSQALTPPATPQVPNTHPTENMSTRQSASGSSTGNGNIAAGLGAADNVVEKDAEEVAKMNAEEVAETAPEATGEPVVNDGVINSDGNADTLPSDAFAYDGENSDISDNQSATLRIGNLVEEVSDKDLVKTLFAFGKVNKLIYKHDRFAIVTFNRQCDASKAHSNLNDRLFKGSNMVTTWVDQNEELDSHTV